MKKTNGETVQYEPLNLVSCSDRALLLRRKASARANHSASIRQAVAQSSIGSRQGVIRSRRYWFSLSIQCSVLHATITRTLTNIATQTILAEISRYEILGPAVAAPQYGHERKSPSTSVLCGSLQFFHLDTAQLFQLRIVLVLQFFCL